MLVHKPVSRYITLRRRCFTRSTMLVCSPKSSCRASGERVSIMISHDCSPAEDNSTLIEDDAGRPRFRFPIVGVEGGIMVSICFVLRARCRVSVRIDGDGDGDGRP